MLHRLVFLELCKISELTSAGQLACNGLPPQG